MPTNEELVIARDTAWLVAGAQPSGPVDMPRTLLTVPVGHESGLTSTSLGLVRGLDRLGIDVGFYKPLTRQTGEERSTALIRLTTPLRPPDSLPGEHLEERLERRRPQRPHGGGRGPRGTGVRRT